MLLSMTGFGRAVKTLPSKKITVEIKSLNSKQFDLNARVPLMLREEELSARNYIAAQLQRGKVELSVSIETFGGMTSTHLNVDALEAYKKQIEDASSRLGIAVPEDWYSVLLRFPETMHTETEEADADMTEAFKEAITEAVAKLMEYRRAEGVKLEKFFMVRIENIAALLRQVEKYEHERIEHIKSRLADSLSKIPAVEYDKGRLEQEMIYYIEKLDVNEEKQRLGQHLKYFAETLSLPTPGQGKKLGFISQEMGREINTLGSKSNQADMQRIVVMMKDELEQIKEQVLNVM